MRIALVLATGLCLAVNSSPAPAAEPPVAPPGDTITWIKPLTEGYAQAEKEKKPLLVCINSERVDGGRVEAAAKELREVTYKDPAVVGRSRQFVCVFLTAEGSSEDFGELRARYAIEGYGERLDSDRFPGRAAPPPSAEPGTRQNPDALGITVLTVRETAGLGFRDGRAGLV